MKRLLMLIVCIIGICVGGWSNVDASYPKYLNGDTNYEFLYGIEGYGFYMQRDSVQSKLYNPPYYTIRSTIVVVPKANAGGITPATRVDSHIAFDMQRGRMTVLDPLTGGPTRGITKWSRDERSLEIAIVGNKMFQICYNRPFWE